MTGVSVLAPFLSDEIRADLIDWAFQVGVDAHPDNNHDDAQLADAWSRLLPHLDPERRARGLELAVDFVRDQSLPSDFQIGVRQLGPFLDARSVDTLESYQWKLDDDLYLYLHSCAAHLHSAEEHANLLERIGELPHARDRLDCYTQLYPHLANELRARCAAATWQLALARQHAEAASLVVDAVLEDQLLATVAALDYQSAWGAGVVRAASDRLPQAAVGAVLAAVGDSPRRLDYAAALFDRLDPADRDDTVRLAATHGASPLAVDSILRHAAPAAGHELIVRTLANRRTETRSVLLDFVSTHPMLDLISEASASAVATSIEEVCQRWDWP